MNVFFSGSSSILASALIESYFKQGHTLFISEAGDETEEAVYRSLDEKIGSERLDIAFFLGSEDIFSAPLGRRSLQKHMRLQKVHHDAVCRYLANRNQSPETIISTSSVLVYQNRNSEKSFESSPLSSQFPAEFFLDLERSVQPLQENGIRVVQLRLGKVVSRTSLPAFPRLPLLNRYTPVPLSKNTGTVSWVSREDTLRAITYILEDTTLSGVFNITSGDILRLRDFFAPLTNTFAREKRMMLPGPLLRIILGQESAGLIESGSRAIPFKLMESGFFFEDISLQEYLQNSRSVEK